MVLKKITVKKFDYIPTGDVNFQTIQDTLDDLGAQMNKAIVEINDRRERRGIFVRSVIVDGGISVELLEGGRYYNAKMLSAFVVAADNLNIVDQEVKLVNTRGKEVASSVTIKLTEKAGKSQSFEMTNRSVAGKIVGINVVPSSIRKVIVTATFSEI